MQEIKILILLLGAAFSAAFLFRLAFGEFRYFRPVVAIWVVSVILLVATKTLWSVYIFLFLVKLLYARNDPLTNMALYVGLLPMLPYNFFLSVLRPLGTDVLQFNTPFVISLLFLVPLLPLAWRGREGVPPRKGDLFFLIFLSLYLVACFRERYEFQITFFSGMRDAMEVLFAIGVPYLVLSRLIKDLDEFKELMKAVALSGLIVVVYVYIEAILRWKIYNTVAEMMGIFDQSAIYSLYEIRHGLLRVSGTMDHPIALGIYLTFVMGATFYLLLQEEVRKLLVAFIVLLVSGAIYMTVSRGAWAGLALMVLIFFLFKLSAGPRRVLMSLAIIGGLVSSFFFFNPAKTTGRPVGELVSADQYGTLDYRIRLFKTAIRVIPDQFWFGSRTYKARPDMQKLKQGQGIIDIVNGYLWIALEMGMIAFFAFLVVLLRSLYKAASINQLGEDLEVRNLKLVGVMLFAVIVSVAVQFASMSLTGFVQIYLFVILAFARAAQHIAAELEEQGAEAGDAVDDLSMQAV